MANKWVCISNYIVFDHKESWSLVFESCCLSIIVSTEALPFFCCLTSCSLSGSKITDKGACAIATALRVNQSLQELKWVQPFMFYFLRRVHWYFNDSCGHSISQLAYHYRSHITTRNYSWGKKCHSKKRFLQVWDDLKGTLKLPYSGKFSLVQIFAEKRPDPSEEMFAVFIFAERGRSDHTPTGWCDIFGASLTVSLVFCTVGGWFFFTATI